jgi:N-acetylglucosaminyl-diphospho-decaprenol L-rhamnosyltransferase
MTTENLITVSVVSHGDSAKIRLLLTSLQIHEKDTKRFQIILTDNLEKDLPDFDPSPWASLNILRNPAPLGFAHNHNNAFQIAQGKWFAIINPDLVFEQPVFGRLLDRFHTDPNAILAPQVVNEIGHVQDSFRKLPTPFEIIQRRLPGYTFEALQPDDNGLIHPDWIAGMFLFMSHEVYRQLGGMNERYRLYFEDVDLCTRARLADMKIIVDTQVSVRHDAKRSSRKKLYYLLLHTQSALRFFASPVYREARMKLGNSNKVR